MESCCKYMQTSNRFGEKGVYFQSAAWGACYIMSSIQEGQASHKRMPDNTNAFAGWVPGDRQHACGSGGICDCAAQIIDCSYRNLTIVPSFNEDEVRETRMLDLSGNKIGMITLRMMLPRGKETTDRDDELALNWINLQTLDARDNPLGYMDAELLTKSMPSLKYLDTDQALTSSVYSTNGLFNEACCEPMPAISKDIPNVTVCNFRDWSVGADCDFEPWIEYADASSYISAAFDGTAAIFQSDVRFPSAAKREECCNLCRINGACTHFVFRNPENGENSCQLKDSGKDPTVRNKTGDDFGPFGLPAYVSGFPAKSRHAGILLAPSAAGPFVSSFAAPAFTRSS